MVRSKEYQKHVLCLEGNWDDDARSKYSIKGALTLLEDNTNIKTHYNRCHTLHEAVTIATKFAPHTEYGIFYFSFHGSPQSVFIEEKNASLEDLAQKLVGKLSGKIVHFGCCETMKTHKRNLLGFLQATDALAVSGYTKQVGFFESTLLDILYFQICQDWKDIRKIEQLIFSSHRHLTRELGFRIVYNH